MKIAGYYKYSVLMLMVCGLIISCATPGNSAPENGAPENSLPENGAPENGLPSDGIPIGTLMSWVDGSTLVFLNGVWIYRSEVTNYQFSLCVEAGKCLLPAASPGEIIGPLDAKQEYSNSPGEIIGPLDDKQEYFNSPAQIIGPLDAKQKYCAWAGGRLPTEDEASAFEGSVLPHPVRAYPLSTSNGTVATNGDSLTGILIGLLLPGTENGIRCVVDAPAPMTPACQASAFYLNGPPTETDHAVTEAGRFCQKGIGYVTLDIDLSDGGILQSVNGDCQVVGVNRILCSNQSGPSGDGEALILVNGLLPAVQREGSASAGQMQCLPGYEANPDSPSLCGFGELLPAVQNDSGFALTNETQFAGKVSLVEYQSNTMPSSNLGLTCKEPLSFSEKLGRCVFDIPVEDLARAGRNTDVLPAWNPITGYPLPNADGTCPKGSSLLNGLYCIPNEPALGPQIYNTSSGYYPANSDGTCPEGTTLSAGGHCVPERRTAYWPPSTAAAANADGSCPEDFTNVDGYCYRLTIAVGRDPFAGYPAPNADGTCPDGTSLFNSLYCIPNEDRRVPVGIAPADDPTYRTLPRNEDGTCPEGTILYEGECILNDGWIEDENGDFHQPAWDALGGYPPPNAEGRCPEGSNLYYGLFCIPNEPAISRSEDLTGLSNWNPLGGYPLPNPDGICPPGSTFFYGHCLPNEPAPSADSRCKSRYWFSETLGVCLPDVVLGCPVGTYFDKKEGLCIASGVATSLTLPGFHFDESSQCSKSDLPTLRYPGCPNGQVYDPSSGRCDSKNIYLEAGKLQHIVQFNYSAPSCEANNNGGDDSGGDAASCGSYGDKLSCSSAGCSWDANFNTCN